jgi:hypothetical protein
LEEKYPEKKAAGRPRLQYLKQVARNTEADSYTANEKNGLQQLQMESCQPIKRLKDKKKHFYENLLTNSSFG